MKWFTKSEPTPEQIQNFLETGESLIAWTITESGFIGIGTRQLILVQGETVETRNWSDSISAHWQEPLIQISFSRGTEIEAIEIKLAEPGLVPTAVRDRVTSVVIFDKAVDLKEIGKVRFVARRNGSEVLWSTMPITQIADTPESRELIELSLQQLRANLGI